MIQLVKNGKFRNTSVTINRLIAGVLSNGDGFPITESILQGFYGLPPITEEYFASMSDVAADQRVIAFKSFMKSKYSFVTDSMLNLTFNGTDTLLCVPDVVESESGVVINQDTNLLIYFDNTGSMGDTYAKLDEMRRTIFKDRLIAFYNNNDELYESKVRLINFTDERAFKAMNHNGLDVSGNTLVFLFQNEANGPKSFYHHSSFTGIAHPNMKEDILALKTRINGLNTDAWRAVSVHIHGPFGWRPITDSYKEMMQAVQLGNAGFELEESNLKNYPQIKYVYDLLDGQSPEYYLDNIITTMRDMGYQI